MYCCITYLFSVQNLKLKAPEVKFPGLLICLGFDISYSFNSAVLDISWTIIPLSAIS